MAILQNVWQKLRSRGGNSPPAVHVAAFGKHPGWNDHIPDLGLETESLVQLKRDLYVDGIGGNIDSGAWESLEPRHRLPDLHHVFVTIQGDAWVMGRLWSSTDGKGRSQYPMVVCAECRNLPYATLSRVVYEHLERAADQCKATRDGDTVTSIVNTLREALRAVGLEAARGEEPAPRSALSILAARPEMGAEREGLMRLLYRTERELSEYCRPRSGRRSSRREPTSDVIRHRGHHIRVPRCADSPLDALGLWIVFLDEVFLPSVPRWIIVPVDERWVDLLVGPVTEFEFAHMRVTTEKEPLVTDIPYRLDEEFIDRAAQLIPEAGDDTSSGEAADQDA